MKGQNYSRKRQAIYDLMCSTNEHPTAEWIYSKLKPNYPDLSIGTVYRNIKLLENNGLVKSVAVVNGCERYDAFTDPHSHFVCRNCYKIIDVFVNFDTFPIVKIKGAKRIETQHLIYYGICDDCDVTSV